MNTTKVAIVGGGFGGVYTARFLEKLVDGNQIEITLFNSSDYFLFTPLLHEVATGGLHPVHVVEPLREIFRKSRVHFVEDTIVSINEATKELRTKTCTFSYDYLVLAHGATTNYYGIKGAEENTFKLKDLRDAILLRNRIIESFEQAVKTRNKEEQKKLLSCTIVGGGATGVELATEIAEYMKKTLASYYVKDGFTADEIQITLITATTELIPQFPPRMRKDAEKAMHENNIKVITNGKVTSIEPGKLTFDTGTTLESHTIIWVAGVTPNTLDVPHLEKAPSKRIVINEFLQSSKDPHIFALGDASGTLPMLAQVASRQAEVVAHNIVSHLLNKPLIPFAFKQRGLLISLGQWNAAGEIFGIHLTGPLMWWLWRTIYLFNFHSWRKRCAIAFEWTMNLFSPRDITYTDSN